MHIIDSHFHWWPRSIFDKLCRRKDYPRARVNRRGGYDYMRRADSGDKARQEGVAIAREMVSQVRRMVQGVQLSAPFGRYQLAVEVAEAIGSR